MIENATQEDCWDKVTVFESNNGTRGRECKRKTGLWTASIV